MKNINDYIEKINTSKEDLMVEFHKNMKDEEFKNIANSINLKDEYLMKYTYKIKQCAEEKKNCKNCKGLNFCKNEVKGCKYSPVVVDGNLTFKFL